MSNDYAKAVFPGGSVFFESYESLGGLEDAFRAIKNRKVENPKERIAYRNKMCNEGDQYSCGVLFALQFSRVAEKAKRKVPAVLDVLTPANAAKEIQGK